MLNEWCAAQQRFGNNDDAAVYNINGLVGYVKNKNK